MASKQHCDICDSTNDAKDGVVETVKIVVNGLYHVVKLDVDFRKEYRDDELDRKDLCNDCKRQAFEALAAKFGSKVEVTERRTR